MKQLVHLCARWERRDDGLWPTFWCGADHTTGDQFVSEAYFATCQKCLEARSKAANEVRPA